MATLCSRRSLLASLLFAPKHHQKVVLIGDIRFRVSESRPGARRYLRIHGNEETARQALESFIETHPGRAYIVDNPIRYVTFAGLKLDPNRMFSPPGAARNLEAQNPGSVTIETALRGLERHLPALLEDLLPKNGEILIALHNNGPGYSVNDEVPISQATHLPRPAEPHEFFLLTSPKDFELLRQGPYNAVLQSNAAGEDDGSLSRLCASRGLRYANLEVAHGKLDIQKEMLAWLDRTLPAR